MTNATHGGARKGAGRPRKADKDKAKRSARTFSLRDEWWARFDALRESLGMGDHEALRWLIEHGEGNE